MTVDQNSEETTQLVGHEKGSSNNGTGTADATAWVDLASPSHPFFFAELLKGLDVETAVTVREKTETVDLARTVGLDATVCGRDFDNTLLRKVGIPLRTAQLSLQAPEADVSLSARNVMCILASKARGIPSIHFDDNDITAHIDASADERLYGRLEAMATHNVVPSAFDTDELIRNGASPESIHTYDGYKESLSVAGFDPDPTFTTRLPFDDYIVIRPEALTAAYVDTERSIVPDILAGAVGDGYNIVYLPRGRGDRKYAAEYGDNVYIPEETLDGLQLAWHSQAVLTGSGTMAREAACMGKPAVSFFPNIPLSVDQELIREGRVFHSRSPVDIMEYISSQSRSDIEPSRERSKEVRAEVVAIVEEIIEEL